MHFPLWINLRQRDCIVDNHGEKSYAQYTLSKKEWIVLLAKYMCFASITGYLFYRSVIASILLFLFIIPGYQKEKSHKVEQRKSLLKYQFKEGILSVSSALQAGYSVENGFREAVKDLVRMYGEDGLLTEEFVILCHKMEQNESIEAALDNLAERSGIQEIKSFAEVFHAGKRAGGDLIAMIHDSADIISMKIEVEEEIQTILSGKQMEEKVMSLVPFFIIFYIDVTSPGFFSVMYGNLTGVVIMSACLCIYGFAVYLGERIMKISM